MFVYHFHKAIVMLHLNEFQFYRICRFIEQPCSTTKDDRCDGNVENINQILFYQLMDNIRSSKNPDAFSILCFNPSIKAHKSAFKNWMFGASAYPV